MQRPSWTPHDVDIERPNAARVYDFYLGGSHNFAADRTMARKAIDMWPELPQIMQSNRAFLRRAVRMLIDSGIRQFIDIGSGIPTVGNVHDVAQRADPRASVVYVDSDPIAVAQSRLLLGDDDRTAVVEADLREPSAVLADPRTRGLIDLAEPVAVLMIAVLHFVPDGDRPREIIGHYRDAMAPGSWLAISHASAEGRPEKAADHQALYRRTPTPMTMRSRDEISALFSGFELAEPGLVYLPLWRPEAPDDVGDAPQHVTGLAGVGRLSTTGAGG